MIGVKLIGYGQRVIVLVSTFYCLLCMKKNYYDFTFTKHYNNPRYNLFITNRTNR